MGNRARTKRDIVQQAYIEQVRAALEEIGKLLDLIDCTDKRNLALLPLFLAQQKAVQAMRGAFTQFSDTEVLRACRVVAAVTPLIRAQVLREAAKAVENYEGDGSLYHIAETIRALKEQP